MFIIIAPLEKIKETIESKVKVKYSLKEILWTKTGGWFDRRLTQVKG